MWFKNIQLFQLEEAMPSAAELEALLSSLPFQPCASLLPNSLGFVAPIGEEEDAPLVHAYGPYLLFCVKVEEKILPPSVVREQLAVQVRDLENRQQRKLYRDEKLRLQEDLYHTLLGQAFSRSSKLYAYLDTRLGYVVLDNSSQKRADQFISLYSKCVGEYPIFAPEIHSPCVLMTRWLKSQKLPNQLSLGNSCVLQNLNHERSQARFSFTDLMSEGVQKVLHQDGQVLQLGLTWHEHLQFTLKQDFTIASIKFLEGLEVGKADRPAETAAEQAAADFAIMAETLHQFLEALLPSFVKASTAVAEMA